MRVTTFGFMVLIMIQIGSSPLVWGLDAAKLQPALNLIQAPNHQRIMVVTTVNPDQSPHNATVGLWVHNSSIHFYASSGIALARNLERSGMGVITVYAVPAEGMDLADHQGFRLKVRLRGDETRRKALQQGKSLKSVYTLDVTEVESLQNTSHTEPESSQVQHD